MTDSNIFKLNKPEQNDLLQEVLREGEKKGRHPTLFFLAGFLAA